MGRRLPSEWTIRAEDISLIVYDFDGVMTDNRVILSEDGRESVIVNRADGLAAGILRKMAIPQLILSKETNPVVSMRAKKLDLPVLQCVDDKDLVLKQHCRDNRIPLNKVVFIGNDINDVKVMEIVGYPLCPQDAYPEAKAAAKFVIPVNGGRGVIRELINRIR